MPSPYNVGCFCCWILRNPIRCCSQDPKIVSVCKNFWMKKLVDHVFLMVI